MDENLAFMPINTGSKAEQVSRQIFRKITTHEIAEGSLLPDEATLAKTMAVNRSSVRQALTILQVLGLVETIHGRGTRVKDVALASPEIYLWQMEVWGESLPIEVWQDILDVRLALEQLSVKRAIECASDKEFRFLKQVHEKATGTFAPYELAALNQQFHETLARIGHNGLLIRLLHLYHRISENRNATYFSDIDRVQESHRQHQQLIDYLFTRNPEEALILWQRHITLSKEFFMSQREGNK